MQTPESNPSYNDYTLNRPSERSSAPYVIRSSQPMSHSELSPAILLPFQCPQVLSAAYTADTNDFDTFASQTHQYTVHVNPEPNAASSEPINNYLDAMSSMPFKIVRDEMNGEQRYYCINQSTGEKMGPVDVSDVLQYLIGPSINYQFGLYR